MWRSLSSRVRLATLVCAGVVAVAFAIWLIFAGGRPCGERADVEARVAALAAANQADAAAGKITVSQLAERTMKLNASATAFETTKDLHAYCDSLDELNDDFKEPL